MAAAAGGEDTPCGPRATDHCEPRVDAGFKGGILKFVFASSLKGVGCKGRWRSVDEA